MHAPKAKGFTLVELLIVVIILSILASIVVPQFAGSTIDAKESALENNLANVRAAIDLYAQQHNGVFPGALTAVPAVGCTAPATKGAGAGGAGADGLAAMTEQLTLYTDDDGGACTIKDATFKWGPYVRTADNSIPGNPVTESAAIVVLDAGDLAMTSAEDPGLGWKYDVISGKFIADDLAYADL